MKIEIFCGLPFVRMHEVNSPQKGMATANLAFANYLITKAFKTSGILHFNNSVYKSLSHFLFPEIGIFIFNFKKSTLILFFYYFSNCLKRFIKIAT